VAPTVKATRIQGIAPREFHDAWPSSRSFASSNRASQNPFRPCALLLSKNALDKCLRQPDFRV